MVEKMLISQEQASELLSIYNKKQTPKRETLQDLIETSNKLIQAAENQKSTPGNKIVNQNLMFTFYQNLIMV